MQAPGAKPFATALLAAVLCGPAAAGVEEIAPQEGRIRLLVDGKANPPQHYLRQTETDFICEIASWDGEDLFGQVAHCEVLGGGYWRSSFIDIDLLFDEFPALGDFVLAPPQPVREVVTSIGTLTLYGFDVDAVPSSGHQCLALVRGYGSMASGYSEMLIGYACADSGAMPDVRADAILRGLTVEGSFDGLLR